MSQQWKWFKQRYYRKFNTLKISRPVLLSGNFQSKNGPEWKRVQTMILSEY